MPRPLWSLPVESTPRGFALAREANRLLVWTESNWLFWTNRAGDRQAQAHFPTSVVGAVSDDGSAFVAAAADGRVSWLAPDLKPRWERRVKGKPVAAAIDPLGLIAAVATSLGQICFFHADGKPARETSCPRPAPHLAFVPGTTTLVAAADLGWVSAFDLAKGTWLWRDGPVATIGGLAVAGSGGPVLLACFSEGLRGYDADGKSLKLSAGLLPCRSVGMSYDGSLAIVAALDGTVVGLDAKFQPKFTHHPDSPPTALAVSALGDVLYLIHADRALRAVALS